MTSTPTTLSLARPGSARSATSRAVHGLLPAASVRALLWMIAPLLAGLAGLVTLAAAPVRSLWTVGNLPSNSIWQYVLHVPTIGTLVVAAILAAVHLPLHVAHGVQRRSYTLAATLVGATAIVAGTVVATAGYAVERALFVVEPTLARTHLYTTTDQYLLVSVEVVLTLATAWASGWLAAIAYYRLGWVRGTIAFPYAVVPVLAVAQVLGSGRILTTEVVRGVGGRVAVALGVLVLSGLLVDRVTRTLELRGTTTWMTTV